ncbi:MAG: M24 family metallopeptidase [Burkholderiales bacterium]
MPAPRACQWLTDFRTRGGVPAIADELRARGLDRPRLGLIGFSSTIQVVPTLLYQDVINIKKALPEAVVYAEMVETQLANGGEPNIFNLFSSAPVEHPADELWYTLHGSEQPLSPTMRPLAAGDIIVAEWHIKYGGYRCHTEYSVYLGKKAPKELLNIWNVSVECLHASKEALTAGRTIGEAIAMIRKPAEKAGLDFVELGFHAMGTASPEFPTVIYKEGYGTNTLNGHRIMDMVLEEGMTFGNCARSVSISWSMTLARCDK